MPGYAGARGPPGSHTMHGMRQAIFVTYGYLVPSPEPPAQERRRGRPRKWTTEAERARAYRERKAEEHASVDELRAERRVLKRQLSDALRGRERAEKALDAAAARADRLATEVQRFRKQLRDAQSQITSLRAKNDELLELRTATPAPAAGAPGLGRQQRRRWSGTSAGGGDDDTDRAEGTPPATTRDSLVGGELRFAAPNRAYR